MGLKGVHLCCDACVDGVGVALKDVEGVESHCDIGNRTVTLTADDDAAAQKALDALAAAGYHGDTGNQQLAMKAAGRDPPGQGQAPESFGHPQLLLAVLPGHQGRDQDRGRRDRRHGESEATAFEVTGDFDAAELVKALNAAGFSAQFKQ